MANNQSSFGKVNSYINVKPLWWNFSFNFKGHLQLWEKWQVKSLLKHNSCLMYSLIPPFIKMSVANHQIQTKTVAGWMGDLQAQRAMFLKDFQVLQSRYISFHVSWCLPSKSIGKTEETCIDFYLSLWKLNITHLW